MSTRVLQRTHAGPFVRRLTPRLAAAWTACTLIAGCAMGQGADPVTPVKEGEKTVEKTVATAVMNAPADMIKAALTDAANRSTTRQADIKVISAEAVTWPDGSLGCPAPGMLYTQALVPGYRILLQAGDTVLNYHAAARGKPVFCPASRAEAPAPGTGPAT